MKNLITQEQLQAYDAKKGTAVVDTAALPETVENRTYRIEGNATQVFVKDTEMATKEYTDAITVDGNEQDENQNIISKAVLEVNALPETIGDKVYNLPNERVFSKDIELSTKNYTDAITVDGNAQDANQNIISKAVLDVAALPSTIGDKVYREQTATTNTTTFTFNYGLTQTEIEALGFVYDTEASIANIQLYRWPETADKTEISFQRNNRGTIYKLTANTLDYNTTTGNYRVYVSAEQGGPQYYITSLDTGKEYNFTVKETNYGGTKVYAKDTELATKEYADGKFIPLTEKAAANGVATLDANGHVPVDQMPTQALIFKGYWDASTGSLPAAGTVSGDFYIVSVEGTVSGVIYRPGDWIIWDGTQWTLSRNTNAVASVNGMTGAVVLNGSNIQATYEGTTDTINTLLTQVGKVKTVNNKSPDANGNITINGDTINATYEGDTDTLNTILTKVGKVKSVDGVLPNANGNIQSVAVEEVNALPAAPENKVYVVPNGSGYNVYAKDKLIKNSDTYIQSVNGLTPDASGNLTFSELPLKSGNNIVGYVGYGKPHNAGTGSFSEDGIYIQNSGNENSGLHMDGQKITFWTPNDEDNVLEIWDKDENTRLFVVNSDGYASKATITRLLMNLGSSVSTDTSNWNAGLGGKIVWGQSWRDSSASTQDTGDLTIFLKDEGNAETANLCIDGDVYVRGGQKCLTSMPSGNVTAAYDGTTLNLYIQR